MRVELSELAGVSNVLYLCIESMGGDESGKLIDAAVSLIQAVQNELCAAREVCSEFNKLSFKFTAKTFGSGLDAENFMAAKQEDVYRCFDALTKYNEVISE